MIPEEQDTAITYFYGSELAESIKWSMMNMKKNIKKVTKKKTL